MSAGNQPLLTPPNSNQYPPNPSNQTNPMVQIAEEESKEPVLLHCPKCNHSGNSTVKLSFNLALLIPFILVSSILIFIPLVILFLTQGIIFKLADHHCTGCGELVAQNKKLRFI